MINEESDTMTHDRHDHESIADLTFVLAQDRITDLRSSAAHTTGTDAGRMSAPSTGLVTRARDAVGRRLIDLGSSVVADERLRQRALGR